MKFPLPLARGDRKLLGIVKTLYDTLPADEEIRKRVDRGYDILTKGGYGIEIDGSIAYVRKLSTSLFGEDTEYQVTESTCSCPDYETARAGLCKHRLAVRMLKALNL
jgi:hypothetical protein